MDYSPWGRKELDTTEGLQCQCQCIICCCLVCVCVCVCVCVSHSVVSGSSKPHGLYSPPGSSVHGIFQARILEGTALPF